MKEGIEGAILCPKCGADLDLKKDIEKGMRQKEKELKLSWEREQEVEIKKLKIELQESIQKNIINEYAQKDHERESLISSLRREVIQLKTKLEQGSQQLQGEVQEVALEKILKDSFPRDEIVPVPKGISGADIIQKVIGNSGKSLGIILWESKKTKSFGNDWIHKLKKDMRALEANIGVIVTETLPNKEDQISFLDGIWVIHPTLAKGTAQLLRRTLLEVATAKRFSQGSQEKAELLYEYFISHQFRHRLESIIESFKVMRDELEKEKRLALKNFKMREKQLDLLMENTVEMCGEIQGTVGRGLFYIPALEGERVDENEELSSENKHDQIF